MPTVRLNVVPTGGALTLAMTDLAGSGMTLERAVSGVGGLGAYSTIYSGAPTPFYVDAGDGLPAPLASGTQYVYRVTDASGQVVTPAVSPQVWLSVLQEPLTAMLIRLLQAGVDNVTSAPPGIQPCQVLQAMPLVGFPAMPFMVVNLDLLQQDAVPIGQSTIALDYNGQSTITGFAKRVYRISVLSTSGPERDFYRDSAIAILESLNESVFQPIGIDVNHRYQVAGGQVADDKKAMSPGFYYADVMWEITGTSNALITPQAGFFGRISTIIVTGYTQDYTVDFPAAVARVTG